MDSAERFSGPPDQALVCRRRAGAPPRRMQAEPTAAEMFEMFAPGLGQIGHWEPLLGRFGAVLDQQLAGLKAARPSLSRGDGGRRVCDLLRSLCLQ